MIRKEKYGSQMEWLSRWASNVDEPIATVTKKRLFAGLAATVTLWILITVIRGHERMGGEYGSYLRWASVLFFTTESSRRISVFIEPITN